jgi:fluoride exporter
MIVLVTALAGGLGAAGRFLLDTLIARHNRLSTPCGTIVVNVTACLLLGLVTGWVAGHPDEGVLRSVIGTGLLGGYSTFSTATVEGVRLIRRGELRAAVLHSGGMLVASVLASTAGLSAAAALS